jgi:hypothetical protein
MMLKKQLFYLLSGLLVLTLLFSACDDTTDCSQVNTSRVKIKFTALDKENPRPLGFSSLYPAERPDSVIANIISYGQIYQLPVDPSKSSTLFIFEKENGSDSLELSYEVQYKVISELCGVEIIYKDLKVKYTTFDSIFVVSPSFERTLPLNLEIFY